MPKCIYCLNEKSDEELTLEHVIPQFLGGKQAPDSLKTRRVCQTCNSNLGLFVDASFEKSFLVFNELQEAAYAFFNPENPSSLPLRNLGVSDLFPPEMKEEELCEYWLGPLGEQVFWIRPSDERMYWYSGGNPRTVKKVNTRAYFLWSKHSQKKPIITWLAFRDAFIGRKVKKITCTPVNGTDLHNIGFSKPDDLDIERIEYFKKNCGDGQERKNKLSMYVNYDIRFMAKLAIGLNYVLFGNSIKDTGYSRKLHEALWFKEGDSELEIYGQSDFHEQDYFFKEQCGVSNGVTITMLRVSMSVAIILNINRRMSWVIKCANITDVNSLMVDELSEGVSIVLFKTLGKGFKLKLFELISHNQGISINPELYEIEKKSGLYKDYFKEFSK